MRVRLINDDDDRGPKFNSHLFEDVQNLTFVVFTKYLILLFVMHVMPFHVVL